jgi:hypothetical protein
MSEEKEQKTKATPRFTELQKMTENDEIVCFLQTFEAVMNTHNVAQAQWPSTLSGYLTGKAQLAFYSMDDTDRKSYKLVVETILRYYHATPEAYREKFLRSTKQRDQTFVDQANQLEMFFKRWLQPPDTVWKDPTVKSLFDKIIANQFITGIRNEDLALRLRQEKEKTTRELAIIADEYVQTKMSVRTHYAESSKPDQKAGNSGKPGSTSKWQRNGQPHEKPSWRANEGKDGNNTQPPRDKDKDSEPFRCYSCGGINHKARDCPKQQRWQRPNKTVSQTCYSTQECAGQGN